MSEPLRQNPLDPHAAAPPEQADAPRRQTRAYDDDPLEELARILGETGGYPARPETTVEVGRRATPQRPMPQQLSALEAELFEELRSSVAPEDRVRGDFQREMPPVIPQRPVNDHEIASLRIDQASRTAAPTPSMIPPAGSPQGEPETPWSDYYAYDEGVAAGSYDPAFGAAPVPVVSPADAYAVGQRATFDDFGAADIAAAAQETSPYAAAEPVIRPHSRSEEMAAARLPKERSRSVAATVALTVGVLALGGGAYAAWKTYGGELISGAPVLVRADGQALKVRPDPKAQTADTTPTLAPDNGSGAAKIYSAQEEPVEQVNGRTPEGKEVRVINPGAQRPNSDTPHSVKTVIVRPDGSIVSDSGAPIKSVTPVRVTPPSEAAAGTGLGPLPGLPGPNGAMGGTAPAGSTGMGGAPAMSGMQGMQLNSGMQGMQLNSGMQGMPGMAPQVSEPVGTPVQVPLPTPAPVRNVAAPSVPVQPALAKPAPQPIATPTITTVQTKPAPAPASVPAPQAARPATPTANAQMSLGPGAVAPKLATAQPTPVAPPPVAPAPAPAAASSASGEWMVQISASKSDADARKSGADAQRRFSALSGRSMDVQQANLGDKGTFYRTRFSAGSREQAAALCQQVSAQGGQCMVVKR